MQHILLGTYLGRYYKSSRLYLLQIASLIEPYYFLSILLSAKVYYPKNYIDDYYNDSINQT